MCLVIYKFSKVAANHIPYDNQRNKATHYCRTTFNLTDPMTTSEIKLPFIAEQLFTHPTTTSEIIKQATLYCRTTFVIRNPLQDKLETPLM